MDPEMEPSHSAGRSDDSDVHNKAVVYIMTECEPGKVIAAGLYCFLLMAQLML